MTIDTLGKDGVSASRNQYLSNLLESTPYTDGTFVAENRGTGYQVIGAELADALMPPPEPHNTIGTFRLVLLRRRLSMSERTLTAGDAIRTVVVGLLKGQATIGTSEVAKHSGRSRATVVKYLNEMIAEGILEPTEPLGSTKQRYRLASKG